MEKLNNYNQKYYEQNRIVPPFHSFNSPKQFPRCPKTKNIFHFHVWALHIAHLLLDPLYSWISMPSHSHYNFALHLFHPPTSTLKAKKIIKIIKSNKQMNITWKLREKRIKNAETRIPKHFAAFLHLHCGVFAFCIKCHSSIMSCSILEFLPFCLPSCCLSCFNLRNLILSGFWPKRNFHPKWTKFTRNFTRNINCNRRSCDAIWWWSYDVLCNIFW